MKNVKFEFDLRGKKAKKNLKKGLAVGTIIGTAAGVIGGILLAPKSGKETRDQIKDNAVNMSKKIADNAKDFTKKTGEVVKEKFNRHCKSGEKVEDVSKEEISNEKDDELRNLEENINDKE
ncbi:MAG: YtxH domain-containing protein [Caloramator sp.]|nr:YtxH domain-containing protein [Caloramator sp.]